MTNENKYLPALCQSNRLLSEYTLYILAQAVSCYANNCLLINNLSIKIIPTLLPKKMLFLKELCQFNGIWTFLGEAGFNNVRRIFSKIMLLVKSKKILILQEGSSSFSRPSQLKASWD